MQLSNQSDEPPLISTLDEALAILGKRTGHIWTRPAFLSFLIKRRVPVHAVAPAQWQMEFELEEYFNDDVGDFVLDRRGGLPADCLLAVLAPHEVENLLVRGETYTYRPADKNGNQLFNIRFTEPIWVNIETVRVMDRTLQMIFEILQSDPPAQLVTVGASEDAAPETQEARQKRRYDRCVEAGLQMPVDDYSHLPYGIGKVASAEGISTAAFSKDVKAHLARKR